MIISYDSVADAVYIKIAPEAIVARTVEFESETFIDLTDDGQLIGVEMLNPSQFVLKRLAKKFCRPELATIDTKVLQKLVA